MAKYRAKDLTEEDYSKYGNAMDQAVMSDDDYAKSVAARKEYMEYEENATNRAENGDAILSDTEKAAREALHSQIEGVRSNYDYSGGRSGDQYIELERQPQTRQQTTQQVRQETPSYVTNQQNVVNSAQNALLNQGAFNYSDAYSGQLQNVADQLSNYQAYQHQDQFRDQMLGAANAVQDYGTFSWDRERPGPYQSQWQDQLMGAADAAKNYGLYQYDPYQEQYRDAIDRNALVAENYGPFEMSREAPQFADQYASQRNELLDRLMNEEKFSYDPKSDPMYQAYKQAYLREGARNRADTLGQAAALTGGGLSTAALAASQQAGDYYGSKVADALPQMQQQAYNQYLDQIMNNRQNLSAVMGLSDQERGWYENDLNQWNTDRDFEYGAYRDRLNDLRSNVEMYNNLENSANTRYNNNQSLGMQAWQGNLDKLRGDVSMYQGLDATDYGRYMDQQDMYNQDRDFARDVWQGNVDKLRGDVNMYQDMENDAYNRGRQSNLDQYNMLGDSFDRLSGRSDADRNFELDAYNNETNRLLGNVNSARNVLGDYYGMAESDRNYAYNTGRAAVSDQQWADQMAQDQAQFEREMAYKENGGAVGARRNGGGGGYDSGSSGYDGSFSGFTTEGGGKNGSSESMNSKYFSVASNQIDQYMRGGNKDKALHIIDESWDQMSDEQREEIQKMLGRYGLAYEG